MTRKEVGDHEMISTFDTVRQDLYGRYGHVCDTVTIDSILDDVVADHASTARITDFLSILVAREAAERIRLHTWLAGNISTPAKRILFVSERDNGRAKFAVAMARHLSDNGVVATAVGTHPENDSDAKVDWVLDERGLRVPAKSLGDGQPRTVNAADVVVLLGGEATPSGAGKRHVHWDIADPAEMTLEQTRELCDDIEMRVFHLLIEMNIPMSARTASDMQAA